ncbi:DUF2164 domain-containing protein [Paenibacillus cremeus]|uniref:DUF2164 domain-containing protein n=1 Tax=Paenibacillus cremeus TaxID=2163881 RepID=A0A559KH74_9BACL|nr:DUF2164 domain-containing protein [Paenibacillus cremeus]TVY11485.1 DUF2164 domain-containing protein [Paenibacillus cremeus]
MIPFKLPKEQKERIIEQVQSYFEEERSESIGNLAAEQIVDFMISALGPVMYNHAIADARKLVGEKWAVMEDELYSLEKPMTRGR